MPDFTQIKLDIDGPIATITLYRPDKMNAFTHQMRDEMIEAIDITDADDAVRAVIVTGDGERAFCAGADLTPPKNPDGTDKHVFSDPTTVDDLSDPLVRDGGGRLVLRLFNSQKPLIGACNGVAVGVGATMQLPFDMRLCSDNARFGFVFAKRGITPEACSSWFLPRLVGMSTALEWCMTGRIFDAQEALDAGLLWRLSAEDHPMKAHRIDSRSIYRLSRGADAKEGIASFLEKRPPEFTGKVSEDMPDFYPWWQEPEYK